MTVSGRRFNAGTPLDKETRRRVEELKRNHPAARARFEAVRETQLETHPPRGADHTPAQRANATQMGNKAIAMEFLGWPGRTGK